MENVALLHLGNVGPKEMVRYYVIIGDGVMKIFVGVTDSNWYNYLAYNRPDEVNFWQPGGKQ